MGVYIGFVFLLILQAAILSLNERINNRVYLIIAYVEVLFVAGFRVSVGGDTEVYVDLYKEIGQSSFLDAMECGYEKGFLLYCYILSRFTQTPQAIIFFSTATITFIVFHYIYKKSRIIWLSIVLYITLMFFFNAMNAMRFALACSILLYASDYIVSRKFLKFIAIVLLASSFHFSALFFISIYFLYPLSLNKKNIFLLFGGLIVFNILFMPMFEMVISVYDRYSSYRSGDDEFYQSPIANYLLLTANFLILLFAWLSEKGKNINLSGDRRLYMCALFLTLLVSIVAIKIMMFTRFITMFSIFSIIYIPNILYINYNTMKYYFWVIVFLFATISQTIVILKYRADWYLVTPYYNCLFS